MFSYINSIQLKISKYKSRFIQYINSNIIIRNTIIFIFITMVMFLLYIISRYKISLPLNLEYIGYIFCFITSMLFSMFILPNFKKSEKISFRDIVYYFILTIGLMIIILFITMLLAYFDLLGYIYADGISEDIANNSNTQLPTNENNNNSNANTSSSKSYSGIIDKELADKTIAAATQIITQLLTDTIGKVVPNLGAAAAGGAVGAAALKASQGSAPMVRGGAALAGSVIGSIGAKTGILVVDSLVRDQKILDELNNGIVASEKIPSHTAVTVDSPFINSPRELTSPLEDILYYQFTLNVLILILIISFLIIILNTNVFKFNKEFISFLVEKILPIKGKEWFKIFIDKSTINNDRVLKLIFIVISINLIYLIILNIFISYHLFINTESFIEVHNHIHNNESSFLLCVLSIKDRKIF